MQSLMIESIFLVFAYHPSGPHLSRHGMIMSCDEICWDLSKQGTTSDWYSINWFAGKPEPWILRWNMRVPAKDPLNQPFVQVKRRLWSIQARPTGHTGDGRLHRPVWSSGGISQPKKRIGIIWHLFCKMFNFSRLSADFLVWVYCNLWVPLCATFKPYPHQ